MTIREFEENVSCFDELIDFMNECGYDFDYRILTRGDYLDYMDREIRDMTNHCYFDEIRDWLAGVPDGYEYYKVDDYNDIYGLDDIDFEQCKEAVLNDLGADDYWDEEEYDEDEEEEEVQEEKSNLTADELNIDMLLNTSSAEISNATVLQNIQSEQLEIMIGLNIV